MGAGKKFEITWLEEILGLGFYVSRFPHSLSINISLIKVNIYIGLGKGYDE